MARKRLASLYAWIPLILLAAMMSASAADPALRLRVLSNRADLISGGDALVAVDLPAGVNPDSLKLDVDGHDVTDQFGLRANGRYEGLLNGLAVGASQLTAQLPDGNGARIAITNHPLHGPVFAGPQTLPWFCDTVAAGLAESQSPNCEAPSIYAYVYKAKNCAPVPIPSIDNGGITFTCLLSAYDPASPPADVDTTTTDQGKAVPFIVRVETGVIDRGIYTIAVLFDPAQPDYQPWAPQDGYNGKVLMTFGGDCNARHGQGQPVSVKDVTALGRGFAVMTSNLNILGHNCNDVVSAESMMMLKEYFIEHYGEIRYTIGNGASGGSIQQHWIVSNYPGLLNGIQPAASFPDMWQVIVEAQDCHLMQHVFTQLSPALWAVPAQRALVAGYATAVTCELFNDPAGQFEYSRLTMDPAYAVACQGGPINALAASGPAADTSYVYNAQTNPTGTRCTVQDYGVSIWGRRASDGFANRPYDNAGVQYGLQALESALITAEQFVDLNEKIGGIDIDWNYQAQRSQADPAALKVAYRGGRVAWPREAAKVPIIDLRGFSPEEIHTDVHSFSMRARLDQANGGHDNQIIWNGGAALFPDPGAFANSFLTMDQWLAAIEADTSSDPLETKVLRNKPAQAVDACWAGGQKITDMDVCRIAFPYFGTPRIAAGGPLADNIFKCRLKPLARGAYHGSFSDAQWTRLQAVFAGGVCDYLQPGVEQVPSLPWLTYEQGPGGQPLGEAPKSASLGGVDPGPSASSRFGGAWNLVSLLMLLGVAAVRRRLQIPLRR